MNMSNFIVFLQEIIKPGSRATQIIQNIDYAPTLLEAAGIDVPKEVQGQSFKSVLEGKNPTDR